MPFQTTFAQGVEQRQVILAVDHEMILRVANPTNPKSCCTKWGIADRKVIQMENKQYRSIAQIERYVEESLFTIP